MLAFAYGFQAKSIQSYILDRTRMREMVGASSLVDALSNTLLQRVLAQMQWPPDTYQLCRCGAGGVTILLSNLADAQRLLQLFSLLLPQFAPGLRFVQAVGAGSSPYAALQALQQQLQAAAQAPHLLLAPPARPFTQRAQRTGRAACEWRNEEWLDQENARKEQLSSGQSFAGASETMRDSLGKKFLSPHLLEEMRQYAWPVELNQDEAVPKNPAFPFTESSNYLGIAHIDGNGLGLVLQNLRAAIAQRDDYAEIEYGFSGLIEQVCQAAAQQACAQVLLPVAQECEVYPARPLVLGGDDITIILRADVALPFVQQFLLAFEAEASRQLLAFAQQYGLQQALPSTLSACAGLVYVRAKFPFYLAYQACEELCLRAKQASKRVSQAAHSPSVLVFERMTGRQQAQYSQPQAVRLLGNAYALNAAQGLPALTDLQTLLDLAKQPNKIGGKGSLYELHALLSVPQERDYALAKQRYARWRDVASKRNKDGLQEFDDCLRALGELEAELPLLRAPNLSPLPPAADGARFAVLGDVLALLAVQGENDA